MRLPGVERAVVDAARVRDYLLSNSRPVGRFKATFFAAIGYSNVDWEALARDLQGHAVENDAVATELSEYGQKYEIRGKITGPTGDEAILVAVWIVLRGEDFPRLVTAFPGTRS